MTRLTAAPPPQIDRPLAEALARVRDGTHDDPFSVLGPHGGTVRVFEPGAAQVHVVQGEASSPLHPVAGVPGAFVGALPEAMAPTGLTASTAGGDSWSFDDPYRFGPVLGEIDEYLIGEGTHHRLWDALGAHVMTHEGTEGTHFAVWAPNARRVSVVGDFNAWDGRRHPMRRRGGTGVWELFLPGIGEGAVYKYEIVGPDGAVLPLKSDPVGFGSQHAPENASVVRRIDGYGWSDGGWMAAPRGNNARTAPISRSTRCTSPRGNGGAMTGARSPTWRPRGSLIDYAARWASPISSFCRSPNTRSTRHGATSPWAFSRPPSATVPRTSSATSIAAAHDKGLGVLLDWVPGHFPTDAHGLARFDGTALYEHADPKEGFHQDWSTLIYNFGRAEVKNYLVANALYWLEEYHVDGLRVDAVASMLYRDYSRKEGEWVPNKDGGRENYEAIAMLQEMNVTTYGHAARDHDRGRGKHLLPGRLRAGRQGGARLRLQVEHGLDERHARLHGARSRPPAPPPSPDDLRPDLRVVGELHPAAQP
jgi:1,4-alpha-glucan branching enzyme